MNNFSDYEMFNADKRDGELAAKITVELVNNWYNTYWKPYEAKFNNAVKFIEDEIEKNGNELPF